MCIYAVLFYHSYANPKPTSDLLALPIREHHINLLSSAKLAHMKSQRLSRRATFEFCFNLYKLLKISVYKYQRPTKLSKRKVYFY